MSAKTNPYLFTSSTKNKTSRENGDFQMALAGILSQAESAEIRIPTSDATGNGTTLSDDKLGEVLKILNIGVSTAHRIYSTMDKEVYSAIKELSSIMRNFSNFTVWVINKYGVELFSVELTEEELDQVLSYTAPFTVNMSKKQISLVSQGTHEIVNDLADDGKTKQFWESMDDAIFAQCECISKYPRKLSVKALLRPEHYHLSNIFKLIAKKQGMKHEGFKFKPEF